MSQTLNVAMIGYKFMGKAHSQAWREASLFFDVPVEPVMKVVCGRHEEPLKEFADRWQWREAATDWKAVVSRDDIDIIDICTPTNLHAEIAIAAAKAGKHIFAEKPFCLSVDEGKRMVDAVEKAGVVHYLNHNYRRCPAVTYAKKMIDDGLIGDIYHWRGCYLQDWIMDPNFPLTWHLRKEVAGAGPHADLNSHSVDLARYLVGEITQVQGMTRTFIKQRPIDESASTFDTSHKESAGGGKKTMGEVTVDDAAFMIVQFASGALGSFESSRRAGHGRRLQDDPRDRSGPSVHRRLVASGPHDRIRAHVRSRGRGLSQGGGRQG
jgi:predicted dehydrogenase